VVAGASVAETSWVSHVALTTGAAITALLDGALEVRGRLTDASNATFYCEVRPPLDVGPPGASIRAVYKPVRGERPLSDFEDGSLARREVAAWHLSELGGFGLVPPTVLRDGPFGIGMVQLWLDVDEETDVLLAVLARDPRLRAMAIFDIIANNADRKVGHILVSPDGRLIGCDHGICFSPDPKLRTVLWSWAGEPLTADERVRLEGLVDLLDGPAGEPLHALLVEEERAALRERIAGLLAAGRLPSPPTDRRAVPWPPF
jgi:hypothetical protein